MTASVELDRPVVELKGVAAAAGLEAPAAAEAAVSAEHLSFTPCAATWFGGGIR
jgi:hypothetical protein